MEKKILTEEEIRERRSKAARKAAETRRQNAEAERYVEAEEAEPVKTNNSWLTWALGILAVVLLLAFIWAVFFGPRTSAAVPPRCSRPRRCSESWSMHVFRSRKSGCDGKDKY